MSFLKPGTPVNRDTVDQAVEAIALACALGVRQREAILQMIETGKLETHAQRIPGRYATVAQVFPNGLGMTSWRGMVKRLKAAGFTVKRTALPDNTGLSYELFWGPSDPDQINPTVEQKRSAARHLRVAPETLKGVTKDADVPTVS